MSQFRPIFACFAAFFAVSANAEVQFNRDIRPILADNCFNCHGPDSASRKADLRLDLEAGAKAEAIVPGKPEESELFTRLTTGDPDEVMPPPKTKKTLSAGQIELIRQWIAQGADWQEHWAFVPPKKIDPPGDPAFSAIDRFVSARLEGEGRKMAPPADARTLIRRLTLDLTGFPPTPEEIAAFLRENDRDPEAFAALTDRLLASPRYGEHRARYWLDVARYADTHGLHLDNYREMWPYRDWVIAAFNANQPFDRFTIEQLAGDLLPNPTQSQRIATGFHRCNVTTSEGGAIAKEFLVRYAVDRVNTTGTVWLGMTVACGQCHEHKFDPISQEEYYKLFAYFNNTTQGGMDGNAPDTPPVIRVYPDEATKKEESRLTAELRKIDGELKAAKNAAKAEFAAWRETADAKPGRYRGWSEKPGFSRDEPFTLAVRVKAPAEPGRYPLFEQTDAKGRGLRVVLDTESEGVELTLSDESGGMLQAQPIKRIRPSYSGPDRVRLRRRRRIRGDRGLRGWAKDGPKPLPLPGGEHLARRLCHKGGNAPAQRAFDRNRRLHRGPNG